LFVFGVHKIKQNFVCKHSGQRPLKNKM